MSSQDLDYYRRRADDERRKATEASHPNIADIHLALAAKYDELVARQERRGRSNPGMGGLTA
jgi:hypothetical protein